jgi:hypothetical protein
MYQNQLLALNNTQCKTPIVCEYAGGRFKLTSKGVSFIGTDKEGKE